MNFKVFIRNIFIVMVATFMLSACATKTATLPSQLQGDVYTGTDTVEYLAKGVPDTLRKQAAWMRTNDSLSFTIEGHADERGTREYNLALGERRANAAKDYLMTYGISGNRLSVISYGKERPVNSGSNPLAWSQNRRSVTVKAN